MPPEAAAATPPLNRLRAPLATGRQRAVLLAELAGVAFIQCPVVRPIGQAFLGTQMAVPPGFKFTTAPHFGVSDLLFILILVSCSLLTFNIQESWCIWCR